MSQPSTMKNVCITDVKRLIVNVYGDHYVTAPSATLGWELTPLRAYLADRAPAGYCELPRRPEFHFVRCPKGCPCHVRGLGRQCCIRAEGCLLTERAKRAILKRSTVGEAMRHEERKRNSDGPRCNCGCQAITSVKQMGARS